MNRINLKYFIHYVCTFLKILILMRFFSTKGLCDIKIIDSDTIIFNEKIRLLGIDAPETNQYC